MKNKRNLWLIVAIVTMIGLAFAFTACDPNNGDQNCATCGKFPCDCPTSSTCTHVFGDNWLPTITASWCVDGVCGNGIETLTCTLCPATNGTRPTPCLGTQGLELDDLGDEYEVGENADLGIVQVCIPDYHNSKPVVGIGDGAFLDTMNETSCQIIESLRIGTNVTYIGFAVFENCKNLETVIFAEGSQLETIGNYAFYGTAIISITIPAGVTEIGSAFGRCASLETVTVLATTPPELGIYAFYQCCCDGDRIILPSLTAIRVPANSVNAYKTHPDWEEYEHLITAIQ